MYKKKKEIIYVFLGISQLTLDEEPEEYESVSDQTSTDRRSGDSLTTPRQNTVTTFGFVDKNNAPLQSPSHSLLTDTHNSGYAGVKAFPASTNSNETRKLLDIPTKLRVSQESFQRAMTNPIPQEFFVDVM
ncbi:unnamed protein product [Rotaria sp. Silwood1]|nr:unnamed protein product [Rotaria sp. Silwood1]